MKVEDRWKEGCRKRLRVPQAEWWEAVGRTRNLAPVSEQRGSHAQTEGEKGLCESEGLFPDPPPPHFD